MFVVLGPRVRKSAKTFAEASQNVWQFLIGFTVLFALALSPAQAQTAHFSYAIATLGGGFSTPEGAAVDAAGNVYVVDYDRNAVEEMPAGCASASCITVLGGGFYLPNGITLDAAGNVYVTDSGNNAVKEIPAGCTAARYGNGDCTITTFGGGFNGPVGIALDGSGNIYVTDYGNSVVKQVPAGCTAALWSSNGCTVTTMGGSFTGPLGVAVDQDDNLYVTDNSVAEQLWTIPAGCTADNLANHLCSLGTMGGGFWNPYSVVVDAQNNVYLTDSGNNQVKKVPSGCGTSSCVITLGSGFNDPAGLALDANQNLYVADSHNGAVKEIMLNGVNFFSSPVGTVAGIQPTLTFTIDTAGTFGVPQFLTLGASGQDFSATTATCAPISYSAGATCQIDATFTPKYPGQRMGAIELTDGSGAVLATANVYGVGTGPQMAFSPAPQIALGGGMSDPRSIAVDGNGTIYAIDLASNTVVTMVAGCPDWSCVDDQASGFGNPVDLAIDGGGNIYVSDNASGTVKKTPPAGCEDASCITNLAGGAVVNPYGIAVDGGGNVYTANSAAGTVTEIPAGCASAGCVVSLGGGFVAPAYIAVDASGAVYVADSGNSTVTQMPAGCTATKYAGGGCSVVRLGGNFANFTGLKIDAGGNLYVADRGNNAIKLIPAGCTMARYTAGDCTVSVVQNLSGIMGLALDASGNLYITGPTSGAVLEIEGATAPSLTFASTFVGSQSTDSPQTVTVTNIGNAPLTFPTPSSGLNPAIAPNFTLDGATTCPILTPVSSPGTLAAGASCTLGVDFAPATSGSISGSVVVTDNNLNVTTPSYATQTLGLSGQAAAPPVVAAVNVPSATLTVNSAAPFTPVVGSGGTGTLSYGVSPSLPAGLTFNPATGAIGGTPAAASAAANYTVTITDQASVTATGVFSLTVNMATPIVTQWPSASAIPAGQTLASSALNGGAASVAGTFVWTSSSVAPGSGVSAQSATFLPTDSADYAPVTGSVSVYVYTPAPVAVLSPYQIATIAGNGSTGYSGDGGPATSAALSNNAYGVAVDASGNIFFADKGNNVVREIAAGTGIVTTIAGTGTVGYAGDGGAATGANLNQPTGVAVDAQGNVYVADTMNNVVRKIAAGAGIITTIAGTPTAGYSGDGGPAVNAQLSGPWGLALGSDSILYITDQVNNVVRAVSLVDGTISTVAGNGQQGYSGDGGPATSAKLYWPRMIAEDLAGNLYIGDMTNDRVRKVTSSTGVITTLTGDGTQGFTGDGGAASSAEIYNPVGIAADALGNVYFSDCDNYRIREVNTGGTIATIAGNGTQGFSGDSGPATVAEVGCAKGMAIDAQGALYLTDTGNMRVRKMGPNGALTFASQGMGSASVAQQVTVTNLGTGTLTFSADPAIAGDFAIAAGNTCALANSTLAPGASCSVPVQFVPSTLGTRSGVLTLSDNSAVATQQSILTGTATPGLPTCTTWPTASPIAYGQPLSSSTLTGGSCSVPGSFAWTTPATVPGAGAAQSESVTFIPTDSTDYQTVAGSAGVTVSAALLTVTASGAAVHYGDAVPAISPSYSGWQNGDGAGVLGSAPSCSTTYTVTSHPGSYSTSCTGAVAANYTFSYVAGSVTVGQATPAVNTWPTASGITYGQTLSSSALSGGNATVAGSFTWSTPGTILSAGALQTQGVTFTPTDTTDYTAMTGSSSVTVSAASLTVTASSAAVHYGDAVPAISPSYSGWRNGDGAGVLSAAPSCSTTYTVTSHPGNYPTSCTGAVAANYTFNYVAGSVTVAPATPTVNTWPTASGIAYGQALSNSTLTGGNASVAGSFAWTNSNAVPGAGAAQSQSVTFTPTNTTDYAAVTGTSNIPVSAALLTVTASGAAVHYGEAVPAISPSYSGWQNGDTATVLTTAPSCTTTYTVTSHPGGYPTSCSGAVSANYTFSYVAGSVAVSKATPTVNTWPTASSIAYGQRLSGATLIGGNATVAGAFAWTTPTTAPGAGVAQTQGVTFTPTDTTDYNVVTGSTSVTVDTVVLTVTAGSPTVSYASPAPTIVPSYSGWQNGDDASVLGSAPACTSTYTPTSHVGSYPSSCYGANAANYTFTYVAGAVIVTKATPTVNTWPTGSGVSYGQTLYSSRLVGGNAAVGGSFAWTSTSVVPGAGVGVSEPVTFTPTDTSDYSPVSGFATLTVSPGTLTVTASSATVNYGTAVPAITPSYSGWQNGDSPSSFTTLPTCTTTYTATSGPGSYPTTCSGAVLPNYILNYVAGAIAVSKITPTVNAWPTASAIAYGQPLSSSVLTGGSATVPGTFTWNTPAVTPGAGAALTESITFTPTDPGYSSVSGSATLSVSAASLTVSASSATLNYGEAKPTITPSYSGWLNGDSPSVLTTPPSCSTTYTTTSHPGSYSTGCSGAVAANYVVGYVAGSVTVSKATPTVSTWPSPASIAYGEALSSSALNGGNASVAGSFAWNSPNTILNPGALQAEGMTFTPTDTTDYNTVTGSSSVTVNEAMLTVTASSATLNYGTAVPTIAPSYSGWQNGDSPSVLTAAAACSTTYTATSHPGSYPTTCSGVVAANYTVNYVAGTVAVSKSTPTVTAWPAAAAITYGQPLSGSVLSGGTATVAGTFTWNTPAVVLGGGPGQSQAVTFTPADPTDYNTVAGSANVTVNLAPATVRLTSSATPAILQAPVTFTATISSTPAGTTGTVTFLDGSSPLGTASVSGGVATFTTSSLSTGSHSITAAYGGDANFAANGSAPLTELVMDYSVSTAVTGAGGATSITLLPGGSTTFTTSIVPSSGSTFPAPFTLTLSGLPAGATATVSPSAWTQASATSWTLPAGTPLNTNIAIAVSVPSALAGAHSNEGGLARRTAPLALALLLLPFAGRIRRSGKRFARLLPVLLLLILGGVAAGLSGCGGGPNNGYFNQAQKTSTVTVTVTSGTLVRTTNFTITVE